MRDGQSGFLHSVIIHLNDLSVKKNLKLIVLIYTHIYITKKLMVSISNKTSRETL